MRSHHHRGQRDIALLPDAKQVSDTIDPDIEVDRFHPADQCIAASLVRVRGCESRQRAVLIAPNLAEFLYSAHQAIPVYCRRRTHMDHPPSTARSCPVIWRPRSLARKQTTSAMSCSVETRRSG